MQHMSSSDESDTLGPEPLGLGATLLSSVFALLVGGVVGVITTFTHRQLLPWGLVGGLLVVVALVVGFRLVFDSRIVGAASAIGVVAATAALAFPGSGGTAMSVTDLSGWIWALGPAILSVIALAWPRPRSAPRADPRTRSEAPGSA